MHWCIAALVLAQAGPTPLTRANTCYQGLWCGATVCSPPRGPPCDSVNTKKLYFLCPAMMVSKILDDVS